MRKTKIVSTIGPASFEEEIIKEMVNSGLDVARFNFSHGTYEERKRLINIFKNIEKKSNKAIGFMLDTRGPEIRTGPLKNKNVNLKKDEKIILTTEKVEGDHKKISITYSEDLSIIEKDKKILLDDGLIELKVIESKKDKLICKIVTGGNLKENKGVNIPNTSLQLPAITEKDKEDIKFGIKHGFHFIAASFMRKASDVIEIRKLLEDEWAKNIKIISKIENQEGVNNIDEIIKVSDGIMVARGDLGVEIPAEQVPIIQKKIINKCNKKAIPVIIATQMLDSMIRNPRPTRAEVSDVAYAVFDGADAIMLSGETAIGSYPVESVKTMARIAKETEKSESYIENLVNRKTTISNTITEAISYASCKTASDLNARAIITPTGSGSTARKVSKNRPLTPIIAVTPSKMVQHTLSLCWGVIPLLVERTNSTDRMIDDAVKAALENDLIECGDLVTITAGVPVGTPGTTNLIKVDIVGKPLAEGQGIGKGIVSGTVKKALTADKALSIMEKGDILVTRMTNEQFYPALKKAAAIITVEGGLTSHSAVAGLDLDIPVIVNTGNILDLVKNGDTITVDGIRGLVYPGYVNMR